MSIRGHLANLDSERRINFLPLTYASKAIIGSGGYRPDDVADVMDIMKSHRWDIEKIITDEYAYIVRSELAA